MLWQRTRKPPIVSSHLPCLYNWSKRPCFAIHRAHFCRRASRRIAGNGGREMTIKVVAISGSIRSGSYNSGLLRAAIEVAEDCLQGIEVEFVEISHLPMLNTDLEGPGTFPHDVEAFRKKILEADSILFASPEYNYSVSAPLKNAIDWAGRPPNVWGDKAAAIVSAGGGFGGGRSHYHLRQIGIYIDLHFINKPEFFLNVFQPPAKFDNDGNLTDAATKEKLKEVLLALQAFSLRLKGN